MTERIAYSVFLTVVFGGLALLTIALVAVFVVLVRSNLRARYPRLVRRRSPDTHRHRSH